MLKAGCCVLVPPGPQSQEASGAADAARQEALELRSQLTAAHTTIKVLQVRRRLTDILVFFCMQWQTRHNCRLSPHILIVLHTYMATLCMQSHMLVTSCALQVGLWMSALCPHLCCPAAYVHLCLCLPLPHTHLHTDSAAGQGVRAAGAVRP
jgi:hypothetical protein